MKLTRRLRLRRPAAVDRRASFKCRLVGQSARWGHWYPWSMPIQIFARGGENASFVLLASLLGALLVIAVSVADFNRREFE